MEITLLDEDTRLLGLLETVWGTIIALCREFNDDDWSKQTECPEWSVKDTLSHLVGIEYRLTSRNVKCINIEHTEHIKNDLGLRNEIDVILRRSSSGETILSEFWNITRERLQTLTQLCKVGFSTDVDTPIGPKPFSELLSMRIMDCWLHEQDIRRAVNKPGNVDGDVAEHTVSRLFSAMPYVIAKKVGATNGTTVVFRIRGQVEFTKCIYVDGKRARNMASIPEYSDTSLSMTSKAFILLASGRVGHQNPFIYDDVRIEGNIDLGRQILKMMNIMI